MALALLRFYEDLNDYLPPGKRKVDLEVPLSGKETVREIIEKLGVPPGEVDQVLVNARSEDLDYVSAEGDRISVYPVFERFDIEEVWAKPEQRQKHISKNVGIVWTVPAGAPPAPAVRASPRWAAPAGAPNVAAVILRNRLLDSACIETSG